MTVDGHFTVIEASDMFSTKLITGFFCSHDAKKQGSSWSLPSSTPLATKNKQLLKLPFNFIAFLLAVSTIIVAKDYHFSVTN